MEGCRSRHHTKKRHDMTSSKQNPKRTNFFRFPLQVGKIANTGRHP